MSSHQHLRARSIDTKDGSYIHVTVPGTAPNSLDDIELFFTVDDSADNLVFGGLETTGSTPATTTATLVNIRCEARVTLPPRPFCVRTNCINGNMDQRDRLAHVQSVLGLPAADESRMKEQAKWTPIFFNSDKVPSWDDEEDET